MRITRWACGLLMLAAGAVAFAQPRIVFLDPAGHPAARGFDPFVAHLARQRVEASSRRVEAPADTLEAALRSLRSADLDADVLVTAHTELARAAVRLRPRANVVLATLADPRDLGFVAADGRRIGNVTGFTYFVPYEHKHLELLREAVPGLRSLGILADRHWAREPLSQWLLKEGPARFGIDVRLFEFERAEEAVALLESPAARNPDAWFVPDGPGARIEGERIAARIARLRKPSIGGHESHLRGGGLLVFQPAPVDHWARVASIVKAVLGGTPAREVAFDRPSVFELRVNLAAARRLGITLPKAILTKADHVIDEARNKP